jgi:hypothetical protein
LPLQLITLTPSATTFWTLIGPIELLKGIFVPEAVVR